MLACWLGALALAAAAVAQDVEIALVRMGVGSHARPGDLTGILVRVTSGLQAPVQARIEWSLRNADGDVARYSADAALAPGAPVERWIYGVPPILTASAQGSLVAVSALRVVEVADGRVVRVLGEQRIDGQSGEEPVVPVETTESLIGVVGDGRAGLSAFATPTPNMGTIASMNELTRIARGIRPSQLPDRWEGLASFDSVIWTNAPVQNLGIEQARALLDWTRRGGNLVIVLPESGDPWGLGAGRRGTPLAEALPERATRTDAVPVRTLMPVLARTGTLRNEAARTALWTFPPDAGNGFTPLALLPGQVDERSGNLVTEEGSLDGQAFAVRRPFGFGFVTVIGIDVDGLDRRALVAEGLPQADIFWNRILGRRADAPTMSEYDQLAKDKRLETRGGLVVTADGGALVNHFVGMQSGGGPGVVVVAARRGAGAVRVARLRGRRRGGDRGGMGSDGPLRVHLGPRAAPDLHRPRRAPGRAGRGAGRDARTELVQRGAAGLRLVAPGRGAHRRRRGRQRALVVVPAAGGLDGRLPGYRDL
jgi:hypothetical protein